MHYALCINIPHGSFSATPGFVSSHPTVFTHEPRGLREKRRSFFEKGEYESVLANIA